MDAGAKPLARRRRLSHLLADAGRLTLGTLQSYLRLDVPIAIFSIVFLVLFAPLIPRNADDPQLLAAYSNDEPFLTMALEATLVPPYGNPGAYFDPSNPASSRLPDRWGEKTYPNITYYGGALFELALPAYVGLRAVGAAPFPTGPIVLRTITLLAGLLALILLYNIGRERGSRLAGLLAAAFLASDAAFIYYANFIHPDTLQLLFGLCAFVFAVRHARDGDAASLVALGLFCGLVQGAKSGGAWTIPMALLAVWLGLKAATLRRLLSRTLVLGAPALAAFFVSTPYAFVDTYYARSMRLAYATVTENSLRLEDISLLTWAEALWDYVGPIAAALVVLTIARAVWTNRRGVSDPALALAVVLALSQFLWYGLSGRLWHVVGYLILSFGLIALFALETLLLGARALLAKIARRLPSRAALAERVGWVAIVAAVVVLVAAARWYEPASWTISQYESGRSTVRAANDWAAARRVGRDASIVVDDLAYFDQARFPGARLHGGVLTWLDVQRLSPDYVVLSGSLFGADWMRNLIATQRFEPRNPDPFNVRLYQDLLPTRRPGPTAVPGASLAGLLRADPAGDETSRLADLAGVCDSVPACDLGLVDLREQLDRAGGLEQRLRALAGAGNEPLIGPEIRIFRMTSNAARAS